MSIPVSTIPAVKAYLFAQLTARSELAAPVLVSYDEPGTYLPDDIVCVGDVRGTLSTDRMVGSGGAGWMNEHYRLEVIVESFAGGDDPQTVTQRALTLAAVVVDTVRNDPQFGGLVIQANPSAYDVQSMWEDEHRGRRCRVVLTIDVFAVI